MACAAISIKKLKRTDIYVMKKPYFRNASEKSGCQHFCSLIPFSLVLVFLALLALENSLTNFDKHVFQINLTTAVVAK